MHGDISLLIASLVCSYDAKNRIDRPVVQPIQFGQRLVGHVAAQFVHLQDKALCVERVVLPARYHATGSAHTKNPNFMVQNKKQSF